MPGVPPCMGAVCTVALTFPPQCPHIGWKTPTVVRFEQLGSLCRSRAMSHPPMTT